MKLYLAVLISIAVTTPAWAHHSFAMYQMTETRTMTGRLTRYVPGSNHAQLIFDVIGPDGKPMLDKDGKVVKWGVETGSAAALARQGVSPKNFPEGTVFTVTLHPLRDGRSFGAMAGLLIKCGTEMPAGGCTKETGQVLISPPA